ncbi:FtsW/RodA/SpoVE family cell cycle protein [Planctomicrobium sp. SH661]|uniref:FtsW/RodA/SpoVE family cell cycle protein n=1 Tax=Planctomicrobium sp. SH661 TaxID=3448124 RepID=UPI003F5C816F
MFQGRTIPVPFCIVLTAMLSIIWLGISGIARGDELEGGSQFASRQVVWLALGSIVATVTAMIPYQRFRGISYPFYALTLVLLVAVYFYPARFGARRWIFVGPISIQPSELAKLSFILVMSEYLMFRKNHRTWIGLIPPFVMTLLPVLLILKEPDLGTALLFFPVLFAMLYTAGARRWHLGLTVLAGVAVSPVVWTNMSAEQKSRVTAVFLQRDGEAPDMEDGYHLHQSKQMLALGGAWGSEWNGASVEASQAYRLPAGRTDFVYCLVGERWGLAGTLGTLFLFSLLFAGGLQVAAMTRDPFGRLLATGIVSILAAQVMINTAMTVGLAPVTGITLPLMSYGGSSLITTGLSMGVLLNIALSPGFDVAGQPFQFGSE